MATVLESPVSPMSAHAYPMHDGIAKFDITHLSGATMADLIMEPDIRVVAASSSASKRSSKANTTSKRSSYASTTKSQLRHSNQLLIDMLQNIQTELATHRTIMLDIQHRVSHLEHESEASTVGNDAQNATLRALEGNMSASRRTSRLVPPEGHTWWQQCQNFARNCDTPFSANEFLKTPRPFSGIDWQYSLPETKPNTPPMTPPDIDDLPALTPTSEDGESSDDDDVTPKRHDIELDDDEILTSTPKIERTEIEDDIQERTLEFDKKKIPAPPMLQPPPSGKPPSENTKEVRLIETPALPVQNSQRYYKGVKSLATYKALLRHKQTEKEHHVLIHFHRRGDLRIEDEE